MATTKITVNSNGSLRIEGDFEIVDKNGNVYDLGGREIVSLCRCGQPRTVVAELSLLDWADGHG